MLDRSQLPLAVGHADVAAQMAFHSSARYFHTGELDRKWWKDVKTLAQVVAPLTLAERAFVIVEGDVLADVTVADGGTVVAYGDVRSTIQMSGHSELVIAGDVLEGAAISGDGILHVFVGGDVAGCLRSRGSCKAWVQGHLRGQVWTGHPSTELRVLSDCTAAIRPNQKPSLLYLEVGGHMTYASLEATAAVGYTEFNASVAGVIGLRACTRTKPLTRRCGNIGATTAGSYAILPTSADSRQLSRRRTRRCSRRRPRISFFRVRCRSARPPLLS